MIFKCEKFYTMKKIHLYNNCMKKALKYTLSAMMLFLCATNAFAQDDDEIVYEDGAQAPAQQ